MRILIIGGCKCGKSNTAQALACKLNKKRYYWATMIPGDDEDRIRVQRHVDYRRDMDFETIECGRNIGAWAAAHGDRAGTAYADEGNGIKSSSGTDGIRGDGGINGSVSFIRDSAVVFDSVTAWLANEMFDENGCHELSDRIIDDLLTVSCFPENFICTVDDMWRDIGYAEWTEKYRAALGKVCCIAAKEFDVVLEVCAGNLHYHKLPEELAEIVREAVG